MMWNWGPGYGWGMTFVGIAMMLLFWGGIFALAVMLVRYLVPSRGGRQDDAMDALRRRLASGEITTDEFERIRQVLLR